MMHLHIGDMLVTIVTSFIMGTWAYKRGYKAAQKYAMQEIREIMARLHWENREPPHCPGCDCGMIERAIDNATPRHEHRS